MPTSVYAILGLGHLVMWGGTERVRVLEVHAVVVGVQEEEEGDERYTGNFSGFRSTEKDTSRSRRDTDSRRELMANLNTERQSRAKR